MELHLFGFEVFLVFFDDERRNGDRVAVDAVGGGVAHLPADMGNWT